MSIPTWGDMSIETSASEMEFSLSELVVIHGCEKSPHLNGVMGRVLERITEGKNAGVYKIELCMTNDIKYLRPCNLSRPPEKLQRGIEQDLLEGLCEAEDLTPEQEEAFEQFLLLSGQSSAEEELPEVESLRDHIGHLESIVADKDSLIERLLADNARLTAENGRLRALKATAEPFKPK